MQDNEEDDDRQDGQNRCRQDRAPVHAGVADEVLDGNLDRVLLLVRQNQQRQDVVVPAPHEAEDRQRDGDVGAQRQHDVGEDLPLAGTVDTRGLDQRQRQRHIVLAVHEDTGRSGDNRQDDAPDVVVQAHGADYAELGDGQRLAGNQGAQQEHAEHEVDVLDLKAVDSQSMKTNDGMPDFVLNRIYEIMKEKGLTDVSRVGLYGLTYKENVDDMRESPTLQLLESQERHLATGLKVYDPFITKDVVKNQYHDLDAFLADVDMVVVMVKHTEIRENVDKLAGKVVLDCHNVIDLPGVYHI